MNWINVKDKLPDTGIDVIWIDQEGFMFIRALEKGDTWIDGHYDTEIGWIMPPITHWMPLPAPPK